MHTRETRLPIDIHLSVSQESDAQDSDAQDIDKKVEQLIDMREKEHLSALNKIKVMGKAQTDVLPEESSPAHECIDEIPDLNLKKEHRIMLQNDEPLDDCHSSCPDSSAQAVSAHRGSTADSLLPEIDDFRRTS